MTEQEYLISFDEDTVRRYRVIRGRQQMHGQDWAITDTDPPLSRPIHNIVMLTNDRQYALKECHVYNMRLDEIYEDDDYFQAPFYAFMTPFYGSIPGDLEE